MVKLRFWKRSERPRNQAQEHDYRALANKMLWRRYRELTMAHIRVDADNEDPRQRYIIDGSIDNMEARLLLDLQMYFFPASSDVSCSG